MELRVLALGFNGQNAKKLFGKKLKVLILEKNNNSCA